MYVRTRGESKLSVAAARLDPDHGQRAHLHRMQRRLQPECALLGQLARTLARAQPLRLLG